MNIGQAQRRFVLNENRCVIDTINLSNSSSRRLFDFEPEDERSLRENLLGTHLRGLLHKLLINTRPMKKGPDGKEYQPHNEEGDAIWWPVFQGIRASHMNSFDPALSVRNKFDGTLKRQRVGMQDFTSLSLFRDDLECLLRDLYGDLKSKALDSLLIAVLCIVKEFTRHSRNDLWKEHNGAENFDYTPMP